MFRKFYIDIITPVIVGLLFIMAMLIATTYAADAQVIGTYTEQNGATKNQIGVTIMADAIGTSITTDCGGVGCALASQLPATLGIKTAALSVSVAPASDGVFSTTQSGAILPTYTIATTAYVAYATPTDMLCVTGSATRIVRVVSMTLQMGATTQGGVSIAYVKRSTANTGGTSSSLTPVALDSLSAAPTAVDILYSVAPTTGNALGFVNMVSVVAAPSAGVGGITSIGGTTMLADFRQPVVLRGVAESLCLNFQGAAWPAGGSATILATWTESAT